MKNTSPVFIIGEARSGSTLLDRTLQSHSSFRPTKLDHVESKIFDYTNKSHTLECRKWTGPYDYMQCDGAQFDKYLKLISPIRTFHKWVDCTFNRKLTAMYNLLYLANMNHFVVYAFFFYAQKMRRSKRISEKSPNNASNIKRIKKLFPKAQLIYIHRHPVDVYSSYRKVMKVEGGNSWTNISPDEFCQIWGKRLNDVLSYCRTGRNDILLVCYEAFVANPYKEFKKICDFLNEQFEEEPILMEHNPDRWESLEKNIRGPIVKKTKNWDDFLSIREAKILEDKLDKFMVELKYERYTDKS